MKQGHSRGDFSDYNAVFLKTPNNNFDSNLAALQTLAERLSQIQGMSPNSFEYNTAIQQITAQEQGEAKELLGVFEGCYALSNYPLVWAWMGLLLVIIAGLAFSVGVIVLLD